MINKKRVFKSLIVLLLIIIIIVAFIHIRNTLARYETATTSERDVDVAFWIVDNSFQTQRLLIKDIYPSETAFEYTFTVSNFKANDLGENDIAETDMEYEIVLTTTTNLPLTYEIQRNGTTYTGITQQLITDTDGTVYREIKFATDENPYPLVIDTIDDDTSTKREITDTYILKVKFPVESYVNGVLVNNRTNLEYPDLMEDIKINLTARQSIDE